MLLPRSCPACGRVGPAPCPGCARELRPAPNLARPANVERLHALLAYEGPGRELVARLKYRNQRSALRWLAAGMAGLVDAGAYNVVTWVPTTARRRRQRGFDQSALLARAVARQLGLPCRAMMRRLPGPAQTGRSGPERRHGPQVVSRVSPRVSSVLLVDDVVTTGSTVSVAAAALRASGVSRVDVVVAARTPPLQLRSLKDRGVGDDNAGSATQPAPDGTVDRRHPVRAGPAQPRARTSG
jgi:ComF family protein